MIRRYLTHEEVAVALGVSREWLYRNKRRLERDEAFPLPVRGLDKLYDPAAIELWQDRQIEPAASPPPAPAASEPPANPESKIADLLDERAKRIASATKGRH